MKHSVVINREILTLANALALEGHCISVAPAPDRSGNSHTVYEFDVLVRSPEEYGVIAHIHYDARSSYRFPFEFSRRSATPACAIKSYPCDSFRELSIAEIIADANAIKEAHLSLHGVEHVERARRAVIEAELK